LFLLTAATLTLVAPDLRRCDAPNLDLSQFDGFDYASFAAEESLQLVVRTILRWYNPVGRIARTLEQLHVSAVEARRSGFNLEDRGLKPSTAERIDDAGVRCLERIDAALNFLGQFDLYTAATAVLAAVRWKKRSPTNAMRRAAMAFQG